MTRTCANCGATFEQSGKGRPRRWCPKCSPSVREAGRAAAAAAWRELNPDAVAAFNEARRKPRYGYLTCQECGVEFHNPRLMPGYRGGHDPKTCSDACHRKRRARRVSRSKAA